MYRKQVLSGFIGMLLLCLCWGCGSHKSPEAEEKPSVAIDLPKLKEQGEITAVTLYGSTSYFQYKMQPMGYEYELMEDFAKSQGLKLHIKVAENTRRLIELLETGEADVVAFPIPIFNELKSKVIYCGHEEITQQVLVQRANKEDTLLTDVTQLIGKTVYVKPHTKYFVFIYIFTEVYLFK